MTRSEIIEGLKQISFDMIEIGTAMDYYGGSSHVSDRGRELVGAGVMARSWAEEWEKEGEPK